MPAKYAHAKKRLARRQANNTHSKDSHGGISVTSTTAALAAVAAAAHAGRGGHGHGHHKPSLDRSLSATLAAVAELERAIAALLLARYEADIARLYSARLHAVARARLPRLLRDCADAAGGAPGWAAVNAQGDAVRDFFRACIAMDLRQAGERVATKSVLWSYTALRHFAMSNNIQICPKRGLHSLRLLPHFPALRTHLNMLHAMPPPSFAKPAHLPALDAGLTLTLDLLARRARSSTTSTTVGTTTDAGQWADWRTKARTGYERLVDALWGTACEFDVRGYGLVLREKLTAKWCDCGCSTDHLGEVCERTVRDEEEESGVRSGKGKEWDGRGSGVFGWQTEEEEDIWEMELDFGGLEPEECDEFIDPDMTVGELMEWRYFKAERAKELGNKAFRNCDYEGAIKHYTNAYEIEPELPHYQLNLAAAHLKLKNWIAAEKACNAALMQHRSGKGYWRRAKARRMQGRTVEAVKDLRTVLKLQPGNAEALAELMAIMPAAAADFAPADPLPEPEPGASSSMARSGQGGGGGGEGRSRSGHSPHNSISAPSSSSSSSSSAPPTAYRPSPRLSLPFVHTDADTRRLRIYSPPLEVEMPTLAPEPVESAAVGAKGKAALKAREKEREREFDVQLESYAYPAWERCKVQLVTVSR